MRDPARVAIIDLDRHLTYGEWNQLADRLADQLDALGVRSGDRIGIRSRIRTEWFIVHRALGKLGAEGVAVSWRLTAPEAEYIVADCGAVGLICDDADVEPWRALGLRHLFTMGRAAADADATPRIEELVPTGRDVPRFGPVRPPLVVYTSGTTGKPKGVPPLDPTTADMARVERYYASVLAHPQLPAGVRMLLTLPVHHAAGPFYANAACQRGGCVVLLDRYDAERAAALIEQHRIQAWTAVPTMLLRLKALPDEVLDRYDLTSMEALIVGAAAVPQALKEWAIKRFGEGVLWETYGCSEAGMLTYASPDDQLTRPGTSGQPFEEVALRIVDQDWNDVDVGEVGEIAASSPVVVDRYLARPPMGPDQFRDGFYRTGDIGRLDGDGYLYITDRVKDMIVAGGVNIYPAEIEAALVQHPDIVDSAVIGIPHDEFGEQVLAFVVPRPGAEPTLDEVRSFLEPRLARYKLPRVMRVVADLPMNPTGKVIKHELRAPFWADRGRQV